MNCRFLFGSFSNSFGRKSFRWKKDLFVIRRTATNNVSPTTEPMKRWFFRRHLLWITFPLSTVVFYRISTSTETRRKHRLVFSSVVRAFRAVNIGFQAMLDEKFSLMFKKKGTDEYTEALHGSRRRNAKRFANFCIDMGGVYVKLGQIFINLPEVVPREYYEELKILQERALRRKTGEIDEIFKRSFGNEPEKVFTKFDRTPIAAASLAEVYRAESKDGSVLAIKVQYSDLRERYAIDVATTKTLLKLFEWFNPDWTMAWMLDELHEDLLLELDFFHEARNAERSRESLKHLDYVYIPKVYWELSKKRILTYEFIVGVGIDQVEEIKNMNLSLKEIDEKLVRVFAEQIFRTGIVHLDLHPGNIHVRPMKTNRSRKNQAQIVLLDHGLYEILLAEERKIICDLWMATMDNDQVRMRQTATALGAPPKDYETFCTLVTMKPVRQAEIYQIPSYAKDWDPMPRELQMMALKSGKLQMPTDDEYDRLNDEERFKLQNRFKNLMDKKRRVLFRILKQMPKTMFLLLRNLNAVRNTLKRHHMTDDERTRIFTEVCQQALKEFSVRRGKI